MHHIAYCFDKRYRQHFGASLFSLLMNYKLDAAKLTIHVVTDEVDDPFREKLNQITNLFRSIFSLHVLTAAETLEMSRLPKARMQQFSRAMYFRLWLSSILDNSIDQILYLDSDTIVLDSVHALLSLELGSNAIAAASDFADAKHASRLGLRSYLNSGVLVMNLKAWRDRNIASECLKWLSENPEKAPLADQCAINVICNEAKLTLHQRWNSFVLPGKTAIQDTPSILHFITNNKPWQAWYDDDLGEHYWRYLRVSPWRHAKPEQPQNVQQAMKLARLLSRQGKHNEANQVHQNLIRALLRKPGIGKNS